VNTSPDIFQPGDRAICIEAEKVCPRPLRWRLWRWLTGRKDPPRPAFADVCFVYNVFDVAPGVQFITVTNTGLDRVYQAKKFHRITPACVAKERHDL
jgi:hypothetical protein